MDVSVDYQQMMTGMWIAVGVLSLATTLCCGLAWMMFADYRRSVRAITQRLVEAERQASHAAEQIQRAAEEMRLQLADVAEGDGHGGARSVMEETAQACEEARVHLERLVGDIRATLGPQGDPRLREALASLSVEENGREEPAPEQNGSQGAATAVVAPGAVQEEAAVDLSPLAVADMSTAGGPAIDYHFAQGWDIVSWKGGWTEEAGARVHQATADLLDDLQGPLRRRVVLDLTHLAHVPEQSLAFVSEIAVRAAKNNQQIRLVGGTPDRCAAIAEKWPAEGGASLPALYANLREATAEA